MRPSAHLSLPGKGYYPLVHRLRQPLTFEQRDGVRVLVLARWALLGALVLSTPFPLQEGVVGRAVVTIAILAVATLNATLHVSLARGDSLTVAAPLAVGIFDAAAITASIAAIDGFDNSAYVLYFPALMSFSAIFPGRISLTYSAGILVTYSMLSVTFYERFDRSTAADWRDLVLRISSMSVTVVIGYLLVRVERLRRMRAVDAEAERQRQLFALEERARAMEEEASDERRRLTRDIHDGVSQGLYMLSLGLEDTAVQLAREVDPATVESRVQALLRVAKQTLLDARGLLLELNQQAEGGSFPDDLLLRQAEEFRAVTGIQTSVSVTGQPRALPPSTVASMYRVLQEGFANVYKHAGATCVSVEMAFDPERATLRLTDNGKGIPAGAASTHGHGIRSMEERASAIGGSLVLTPNEGGGTTLTLIVPAEEFPA